MNHRIQPHHVQPLPKPTVLAKTQSHSQPKTSFKDVFQSQLQDQTLLKISKHAERRLNDRGIVIDQQKWSAISEKIQEAKIKGVRDSLVVLKEATLVVSATNNTVITALGRDEANSQIFTNINGTILMD